MKKSKIWFYVSLLPLSFALLGFIVSMLVLQLDWDEASKFPLIIQVFFCEVTFVVSMLGLVSYMQQPEKTKMVKNIRWMNFFILMSSLLISVCFFLC